ncbi:MAG: Holliday junction resolvase RuvX [bacterium]
MPRILCLDVGERRTGVAISDETRAIAQSLLTIAHKTQTELITAVRRLILEYDVEKIVIGLPLSLSGKPSTRSEKIRHFAAKLKTKLSLPVELWDERFSTNYAEKIYTEVTGRRFHRNATRTRHPISPIDRIAATVMLENYLENNQSRRRNGAP